MAGFTGHTLFVSQIHSNEKVFTLYVVYLPVPCRAGADYYSYH